MSTDPRAQRTVVAGALRGRSGAPAFRPAPGQLQEEGHDGQRATRPPLTVGHADGIGGRQREHGTGREQGVRPPAGEFAEAAVQVRSEPEAFGQGSPAGGVRVERGVQFEGLADGELGLEFTPLELDAENPGDPLVVGDRVEAGDADPAGVGDAQALDAFDGGRLAGAVGAEDAEDLALLDGEGEAVHDGPAPVGRAQIGDFDEGHGTKPSGGRGARTSAVPLGRRQPIG